MDETSKPPPHSRRIKRIPPDDPRYPAAVERYEQMVNSAIASAAYLTPENLATEEEYFEDLAATDPEKARELALAWKQKKGEEPSAEG